jgi:hypothetical protein
VQDSPAFDFVCVTLERLTQLSRLQARGTVRLVLRQAGLEPHAVTPEQLSVVVERLLPPALSSRHVTDADYVARRINELLVAQELPSAPRHEAPEDVLRRFSRR